MYIRSFHIENIRCISRIDWEIPEGKEAGWHVIIGDNGSGKSTVLRAVALALIGPHQAGFLRENWSEWQELEWHGMIELHYLQNLEWDIITEIIEPIVKLGITHYGPEVELPSGWKDITLRKNKQESRTIRVSKPIDAPFWEENGNGWFSASYGPFRRFTGGSLEYESLMRRDLNVTRHLSLFGEHIALTEPLSWLQNLKLMNYEQQSEGVLLYDIQDFINKSNLLPHNTYLQDVSSKGVEFVDGNGTQVRVENLSDGFRSILSLTFELIRQLVRCYGHEKIFNEDCTQIIPPGVVLIDEVDAHLHPTWQRQIGVWFRKHFPNIQFIVTTHSPLVCQAAEVGTVFRLPRPGTDEVGEMIDGVDLDRLLYGNILDAYSTELFGLTSTRSDTSKERLQRLALLNQKELHEKLTEEEIREQEALRASMPTAAHIVKNGTAE